MVFHIGCSVPSVRVYSGMERNMPLLLLNSQILILVYDAVFFRQSMRLGQLLMGQVLMLFNLRLVLAMRCKESCRCS